MATVDMTVGTAGTPAAAPHNNPVQVVEAEIDFAAAVTAKGSALAQGDVIECLDLPAGSYILGAGIEVVAVHEGTSTDTDFDLGITGGDVDNFVDGFDFDGASVGDYASAATPDAGVVFNATADTLDLLLTAMTGTTTGGKIRVFALLADVTGKARPGVAAAGS